MRELQVVEAKVKEAVKVELGEARETVKREIQGALVVAKRALRSATIGKVEMMARRANAAAVEARDSVLDTLWQNPLPTALAGAGLARSYMNRRNVSGTRGAGHGGEYYENSDWRRPSGAAHEAQHNASTLVSSAGDAASHVSQAAGLAQQGMDEVKSAVESKSATT